MIITPPPASFVQWLTPLTRFLDPRFAHLFPALFLGLILSRGRRTVTSWIRAAALSPLFPRCYRLLASIPDRAHLIASYLLVHAVAWPLRHDSRILLVGDDTVTRRYGPRVQGAAIHRNPTPGPARQPHLYGHVFVVLAVIACHPLWGNLALPLLASLYLRRCSLDDLPSPDRPEFQTKIEQLQSAIAQLWPWLVLLGKPIHIVVDGAYAAGDFLDDMREKKITVFSRLRANARLHEPPPPRRRGQRGRPRKYGRTIDLKRRASSRSRWTRERFFVYGAWKDVKYKTFVALWPPACGAIRVVIVRDRKDWRAFFCTDTNASVKEILETIAARFSIETMFREVKQVLGAGQQQTRRWGASLGCFLMNLWAYTLTVTWSWSKKPEELTAHREESPWDVEERRPSFADLLRSLQGDLWPGEIMRRLGRATLPRIIRDVLKMLGFSMNVGREEPGEFKPK
jgi:hypothetical protein